MINRILIIGSPGAGKSTLARSLSQKLGLEIIHLDQYYWKENWQESKRTDWEETIKKLIQKDQWIMDGNYGDTMDIRINRADSIIYLDFPTRVTLFRIIKRIIKYHGKVRPDMPAGCKERFEFDFLHYVAIFRLTRKKGILKKNTTLLKIEVFSINLKVINTKQNDISR